MAIRIRKQDKKIKGKIHLAGSKSISNRALIIRALCRDNFAIEGLAASHDTQTMLSLLSQEGSATYDAGPAGTTFRFMTAYLSLQKGSQILTGSERMKQRPIGVLVDALKVLGADIEYLEKEGYPPLKINEASNFGSIDKISLPANISSQYISALLMIAPTLPNGLSLELEGEIVSIPYIEMTLNMMAVFGIEYNWEGQVISIAAQSYQAKPFTVEADWSAASYYYSIAALADEVDLELHGLFEESTQGDSAIAKMMEDLGVQTTFHGDHLRLTKSGHVKPSFEYDFIKCPDLAQTLVACCAGMGVTGLFTGLQTLRIKETDRIAALKAELIKGNAYFTQLPPKFSPKSGMEYHMIDGQFEVESATIETYEDHRMAMALAPLSMLGPLIIEDKDVVNKSYPAFWKDLETLGFEVEEA